MQHRILLKYSLFDPSSLNWIGRSKSSVVASSLALPVSAAKHKRNRPTKSSIPIDRKTPRVFSRPQITFLFINSIVFIVFLVSVVCITTTTRESVFPISFGRNYLARTSPRSLIRLFICLIHGTTTLVCICVCAYAHV